MPRKNRPILAPKPNLQATSCLSKRRYASKKQAQTAADKRMLLSQDLELNIYHCNQCLGWHLTSKIE
ncbi:hypothetical protein KC945_02315 [Candidatus Saccharibacteria bacterium]|jgi:hypothetical protein|nr:hypothetical protein [Candidatus Saccharibacteria bacterium]